MDTSEFLIFILSVWFTIRFFIKWYQTLFRVWPSERAKSARHLCGWLPVISLVIIIYTLKVLASFDVVDDFFYIFFYICLGYAWLFGGLIIMSCFFDLSWIDDVFNLNNKAALFTVAGGFLGLTFLYSGANIGDGPGWWCVIFAGGLGLVAWILLALLLNQFTRVFERVTINRDLSCGIRTGFYLLASGILLARASAGDWTSFSMTVVEFMDGWPVLPLTIFAILIEQYEIHKPNPESDTNDTSIMSSVLFGILYVIIAVISITLLPPLGKNPVYSGMIQFAFPGYFYA